ncbi:MAG: hypothetical protein JWL62_3400 [Hyphomicrobiales bacterium]|nr:hypothetical protein [Hyphomicrobiales bacterium]
MRNGWGYAYDAPNNANTYDGYTGSFTSNKTRIGYAVVAGIECALTQNWSVKLEGLYMNLGNNGASCPASICGTQNGTQLCPACS